jgi:hypothetical protein
MSKLKITRIPIFLSSICKLPQSTVILDETPNMQNPKVYGVCDNFLIENGKVYCDATFNNEYGITFLRERTLVPGLLYKNGESVPEILSIYLVAVLSSDVVNAELKDNIKTAYLAMKIKP